MHAIKLLIATGLLAATTLAHAAVQSPREGLVVDSARAPQRRGAEVLYPLQVDRAVFERAVQAGGAWLPAKSGLPQRARFTGVERHKSGDWTWIGHVETEFGEQAAVITFGKDAVFGVLPQRFGPPMRIETRQGRTWLVEGQLPFKRPPMGLSDGLPPTNWRTAGQRPDRGDSDAATKALRTSGRITAAAAAQVDVLVAYTPAVVTHYGTDAAVQTRIAQLVAIANTAYADTGAAMHINLVGTRLLNYTAATDNSVLLDLITDASASPVKTQVDAWRTETGADLVSVVRAFNNTSQTNCGLAWIGGYHGSPYDESFGFSVVGDGEDGGFFCYEQTFAHELGHNMGSGHDITTDSGDFGAYTDSRGHRQTISPGNGFATVMAYPTADQTVLGIFSNPALNACMGQPCGVTGESNNVHTFSLSGPPIAAYRASANPLPTLSIGDVTVTEGNSGTKLATFTVTLSANATSTVSYSIATANGTASAGSDYVASSLTNQTITAGHSTKTFAVTINGDTALENNETFAVNVSAVSGATVADGAATGTITNDDSPSLTIADASVAEGNSGTKLLAFTVKLSAAAAGTVTFNLATGNGTATAGSDYTALSLTGQTIAAGATSKVFNVVLNGDTGAEANETFNVTVSGVTGPVSVGDGTAVGTIVNDDGAVLTFDDIHFVEGNAGTKAVAFLVKLSQAVGAPVTFSVATADGTAKSGSDYVGRTLTNQTILAGQLSKPFSVTINGDTTFEQNEAFTATLSAVTGPVTVLDGTATATITNDEGPTLSIADVMLVEGNAGTRQMNFVATLSAIAAVPVTFKLATAPDSASAGSDYVHRAAATYSIPAGETTFPFAVTINGDATIEPNDTFFVNLTAPTNATIADAQALGTIVNDEGPLLTIANTSTTEGDAGDKLITFTLTVNPVAATPTTFTLQTVNNTATGGSDFLAANVGGLVIPANTASRVVNIKVYGDTGVEADETFFVLLRDVTGGASVFDDRAIGTITNDD